MQSSLSASKSDMWLPPGPHLGGTNYARCLVDFKIRVLWIQVAKRNTLKILIGIREQSKMLASFYSEYIKNGGTNSLQRLINHPRSTGRYLIDSLQYYPLIKKYQELFEESNVKVLLFEEFIQNPILQAQSIENFLNIGHYLSLINISQPTRPK